MGLTVSGGAESIAAHAEDLRAVADQFDRASSDTDDIADYTLSWQVRLVIGGYGWPASELLERDLATLGGPWSTLRQAADSLHSSAFALRWAAAAYEDTDHSIFDTIGDAFGAVASAADAGFDAVSTAIDRRSLSAGAQTYLTDDPGLVDGLTSVLLFTGLEQVLGPRYPDGRPVVHDLGRDDTESDAPRSLTDLVDQLGDRDQTSAGEVSVSFVTGADGRRRAIVDVPGTKSWDPGQTSNITSLSTNARALVGAPTAYERGVLDAMDRAGVRASDQVMLVGHSEGGMVAVNAARDAVLSGRFDVTHVVTAGSPIGRTVADLPDSVRVLALENDSDIVPELDDADNPALPNVTTVRFHDDSGTISGNHGLETAYRDGATEADASDDPSIGAFTRSAQGFLDGSDEDTEAFLITRKY